MTPSLFVLAVTRGPDQGKQAPLGPGRPVRVGSGDASELRLSDPKVLEHHCSVEIENGQAILTNRTANAGTFVGEQKVTRVPLQPAQAFRVGDTVVQLRPAPKAAPEPEKDPLIGKSIGGYALREVIGRGGMGTVYRATQLSLHRDVALKLLAPDLAKDVSFRDLFINEARAAGQLVHPNVVQVYDAGTAGEHSFFSMELISQGSVEEVLERKGKIPWQEAILLVLDAAHGLEYAEKKQIVHRDIKPDNLMLNEDGRVKIADLGLAKRGEAKAGSEGIIGTPHFIPPEQALGKEVDSRADIYSLGATFFRMITGKTLFTGKTAKEIVLKHIKEPPPLASSEEEGIPSDLDALIAKMLEKEPSARFANTHELIAALEEVCAHHGIKGAIIKKGVGKKVVFPLIALLAGAIAFVVYLKMQPEKVVDNPEQKRAAEEARKRAEQVEREKEQLRIAARTDAVRSAFKDLDNNELRENSSNPIDDVFVDASEAPSKKKAWSDIAQAFEDYAGSAETKELAPEEAEKAAKAASRIRKRLDLLERTTAERNEKLTAKLQEAVAKTKELEGQFQTLVGEFRFSAAVNLCDRVAKVDPNSPEPRKEDPYREILLWKWASAVNPEVTLTGSATRILQEIRKARFAFEERKKQVVDQATKHWAAIKERAAALSPATPPDEVARIVADLKLAEERYPDPGQDVPEIQPLAAEAHQLRVKVESEIRSRAAADLARDRETVFREIHQIRSLSPDVIVNPLMNADYPAARAAYERLLAGLRTERYRRFVEERMALAGWMEWLLSRFKADVAATVQKREGAPLRTLDLELAPEGGATTKGRLDAPPPKPDEFGFAPAIRGDKTFSLGEFPMDWVYGSLFCWGGKPRWSDEALASPELRFALAAFCFETFQFREAKELLGTLRDDPALGPAAKSLEERAGWEASARSDYAELLAAIAKDAPSGQIAELLQRVQSYSQSHKGSLFLLAVLPPSAPPSDDFAPESLPGVPPPPPAAPG